MPSHTHEDGYCPRDKQEQIRTGFSHDMEELECLFTVGRSVKEVMITLGNWFPIKLNVFIP